MEQIITQRSHPGKRVLFGYKSEQDFFERNYATEGPNGLVRAAIGEHCIGHGEGTWDYIPGEFS